MYLSKTPEFLKPLVSSFVWDVHSAGKQVFLTFDDGPHTQVTPAILDILDRFDARATFFCVGANVERNPATFEEILHRGHAVGNHTYNHESGWETSQFSYLKSYLRCQALTRSKLFRPPYGRIKREQVKALKAHTHLIMWDVLSGDFDPKRSVEKCAETVVKNVKPGSIIVFHDSAKARDRVLSALPIVLENLRERGFEMNGLTNSLLENRN